MLDFFRRLFRASSRQPQEENVEGSEPDSDDSLNPFPDTVVIKITDVFDLHSIPPRQVRAVVEEYLSEARERGLRFVRIIHGKGIGVQREIVRSVLSSKPFVLDFTDAPPEAGGWGATVVTLSAKTETDETTSA